VSLSGDDEWDWEDPDAPEGGDFSNEEWDTGRDDLVEIGCFEDEESLHDYGLVVLSAGEPYWVDEDEEGYFYLLVEPRHAKFLSHQLDLYEHESRHWPPVAPVLPEPHAGAYAAMTWAAALFLSYLCQLRWPQLEEWGVASSEAIRDGEAYRALSALFLHGDIGHLAGNLLFGAVFVHLVARHLGTLFAMLGVLAAGACGNYLNAVLHFGASHYSIGASTAVFGAVGILAAVPLGFGLRHGSGAFRPARLWLAPVVVGLVFLAWFGTGGEQTDTAAHLTGFACGLPIGLLAGVGMRR
jgi:membrane associated rhomboid family serine protease